MKSNTQLINNIIGQLSGIQKMLENDKECFEVYAQMKAANSSMKTLMNRFMAERFMQCMEDSKSSSEQEKVCNQFFSEIIKHN